VLVRSESDPALREALEQADLALTDSGLMVLVWNLWKRDHIRRVSGLQFLEKLLCTTAVRCPGATFWIAPDEEQVSRFRWWLQGQGVYVEAEHFYIAPRYGEGFIKDDALRRRLEQVRPGWVILCIGGGVQERLGLYLRRSLTYRPAIVCVGAAIGFLAGTQARIPMWADRLRVGWLVRCLDAPGKFVPRYWEARKLIGLLLRYGPERPVRERSGTGYAA
jgi:UDP-N-acetyl-D-mannosaminuronic acid transferase (WecB/TagA/CpsF family)